MCGYSSTGKRDMIAWASSAVCSGVSNGRARSCTANRSYLMFHGWDTALTRRALYSLPLTWRGGVPVPQFTTGG
jgi:hypothetical protein